MSHAVCLIVAFGKVLTATVCGALRPDSHVFSFIRTDCCCFCWPVCPDENIKCLWVSRPKFHLGVIVVGIYGFNPAGARGVLKIHL